MSTPRLKMHHITKAFPGVLALDNMQLEVEAGEVHILLGENGAGKSTLMKILSGAHKKDGGTIQIEGQEVEIRSPKHAQELGVGIIYQELNLIPHLSVGENIFLAREPKWIGSIINQKKLHHKAQNILNDLGLKLKSTDLVQNLSVAEQQMVEVAKALSLDAKILVMDEPTSALAEEEIEHLFKTINLLRKKGVSIIYISHRMKELFEIGDRVTVFRDGKYINTFDIKTVNKDTLIQNMVGRKLENQFPKEKAPIGNEILNVENLNINGVLHNINLTLKKGEVLGIAGLMGSGRTELAKAIFGALKTTSGGLLIHGQKTTIKSPYQAISKKIGFLTEDRKQEGLVLILPVKENITLASLDKLSKLNWLRQKSEKKISEDYVQELNIKTPSIKQQVQFLSGGNQQKVVLSKWLCSEAEIFIFDEPTRGIDVGAKVEIYKIMNTLCKQGKAIIMISSELPEILGMSDRILVMNHGKITGQLSAENATQEKILELALKE